MIRTAGDKWDSPLQKHPRPFWPSRVYFKDDKVVSVWALKTDPSALVGCSFLLGARLTCVYGQVQRCSSTPHPRTQCLEISPGTNPSSSTAASEMRVTKSGAQALRVQGQTGLCPLTMRSSWYIRSKSDAASTRHSSGHGMKWRALQTAHSIPSPKYQYDLVAHVPGMACQPCSAASMDPPSP